MGSPSLRTQRAAGEGHRRARPCCRRGSYPGRQRAGTRGAPRNPDRDPWLPDLPTALSYPCWFGDSAHAKHAPSLVEGGLRRRVRGMQSSGGELDTTSRSRLARLGAEPGSLARLTFVRVCPGSSEQEVGGLHSAWSPSGAGHSRSTRPPLVADVLRRTRGPKTIAAATTPCQGRTPAVVVPVDLHPPLEEHR